MSYESKLEQSFTRLQKLKFSLQVENIKRFIHDARRRWKPRTKEVKATVYHGKNQGDVESHTLYWNEYECSWTTKEMAFNGYVFKKVQQILNKEKIEKYNQST